MNREQEEIKDKARSKRQRRAKAKGTRKTLDEKEASVADPNATLTEKVIDLAQGAAAQVSDFVKAAAHKITGATGEVDPPSVQKKP